MSEPEGAGGLGQSPLDVLNSPPDAAISRDRAINFVRSSVSLVSKVDVADVQPSMGLAELGLGSLGFTQVLIEVADQLGFELPEEMLGILEDAKRPETVKDLYVLLFG